MLNCEPQSVLYLYCRALRLNCLRSVLMLLWCRSRSARRYVVLAIPTCPLCYLFRLSVRPSVPLYNAYTFPTYSHIIHQQCDLHCLEIDARCTTSTTTCCLIVWHSACRPFSRLLVVPIVFLIIRIIRNASYSSIIIVSIITKRWQSYEVTRLMRKINSINVL